MTHAAQLWRHLTLLALTLVVGAGVFATDYTPSALLAAAWVIPLCAWHLTRHPVTLSTTCILSLALAVDLATITHDPLFVTTAQHDKLTRNSTIQAAAAILGTLTALLTLYAQARFPRK